MAMMKISASFPHGMDAPGLSSNQGLLGAEGGHFEHLISKSNS